MGNIKIEGDKEDILSLIGAQERAKLAFFDLLHQSGHLPQQLIPQRATLSAELYQELNQIAGTPALPPASPPQTCTQVSQVSPASIAVPIPEPDQRSMSSLMLPESTAPRTAPGHPGHDFYQSAPSISPVRRSVQWMRYHPGWAVLLGSAIGFLILVFLYRGSVGQLIQQIKPSTPVPGAIGEPPVEQPQPQQAQEAIEPQSEPELLRDLIQQLDQPAGG